MEKDRLFSFRNTIRDKDSKGRDRLQVYLNQEDVADMVSTLQSIATNEKGIKFIFHTEVKTAAESNRQFDSTFGFVKAVQAQAAVGGTKKVVPKGTAGKNAADVYNGLNKTIA